MSEDHDPISRLLSELGEPEPPRPLRERTLARAQAAWARPPVADPWSRLWHNSLLRLAWAAIVVLLLAANFALRSGSHARPRTTTPVAAREQIGLAELRAIVELPRLHLQDTGIDAPQGRAAQPRSSNLTTQHHEMEDKS